MLYKMSVKGPAFASQAPPRAFGLILFVALTHSGGKAREAVRPP